MNPGTRTRGAAARGLPLVKRHLLYLTLAAVAATTTLTGCPEKGPGEKAGEAIDGAGEKLKDAITPDGPAEDLGEKLDDATR